MAKHASSIKNSLVDLIIREFPELAIVKAKLVNTGVDHAVLIVNDKLIFRFPRTPIYLQSFAAELKLLSSLRRKCTAPIPHYRYLPKNAEFGGYELLAGKELSKYRFGRMSATEKTKFIADIAQFLTELHQLQASDERKSRSAEPWSGAKLKNYKTRYWDERRSKIKAFVNGALLNLIDRFYEEFPKACRNFPAATIIHGDLSCYHMLIDSSNRRLSGIIDFGDATVGDPAHDFEYFWVYGDDVAKAVFANYGRKTDQNLLTRSHWYHLRYQIDLLYFMLKDREITKARGIARILNKHLPDLLQ